MSLPLLRASRFSSQTTDAGKAAAAAAAVAAAAGGTAAADGAGAVGDLAAPPTQAANIGPVVYKPITKHELSLEQQLYYQSVTQGMLEPNNAEYCEVGPRTRPPARRPSSHSTSTFPCPAASLMPVGAPLTPPLPAAARRKRLRACGATPGCTRCCRTLRSSWPRK